MKLWVIPVIHIAYDIISCLPFENKLRGNMVHKDIVEQPLRHPPIKHPLQLVIPMPLAINPPSKHSTHPTSTLPRRDREYILFLKRHGRLDFAGPE